MKKSEEFQKTEINKLEEIVDEVIAEIATAYKPGVRKWIVENRPDLINALLNAEDDVNCSWKETTQDIGRIQGFLEALKNYRQANLKLIQEYEKLFPNGKRQRSSHE